MSVEATINQERETAEVSPPEHTHSGPYYRPNVDIYELADQLVVQADVPGAQNNRIDIQFEDGALTIHARVPARQESQGSYLRQEYGVGDFYRTFRVSEQIDASRISAEYAGGVLTLHLPKIEAAKPRKIKVAAK
jgi:HSP20 family molecular chaperone IbpA